MQNSTPRPLCRAVLYHAPYVYLIQTYISALQSGRGVLFGHVSESAESMCVNVETGAYTTLAGAGLHNLAATLPRMIGFSH